MTEYKTKKSLEKLSTVLESNKSLQKETFEKLNADVLFEVLTKSSKTPVVWVLKSKDADNVKLLTVGGGESSSFKPDITIKIDDLNLKKLINGKQSAQKLFMMGKLKIKGNVMKASFIEKLLKFAGNEQAKL